MRFLTQKIQNTTEGKIVQNFLLDGWLDSACIGKFTGSTTYCVMVIMSPHVIFSGAKLTGLGGMCANGNHHAHDWCQVISFKISYAPGAVAYIDILPVLSAADPGFLEGGFISIKRGFVFNILSDYS